MNATDVMGRLSRAATPLLGPLTRAHIALYRRTGGRLGYSWPGFPAMLLLDHEGARSGQRRTTPLLFFRDPRNPDDLILVASYAGNDRHPGWYHNLRANPDTTVQVRDEVRPVHARVADPAERERLWPEAVRSYPAYAEYQRNADTVGRTIPLVVLTARQR